jgi:nickel/cobalt transporter (NicO) family protein
MNATPALLLAAGGVGLAHAVLPDHWMPLALVSRTRRYSVGQVARLSTVAGLAHVVVSVILGAVVIAVGLQLRHSVESAQSAIVGTLLIGTGIVFLLLEVSGRGHGHPHHGHPHGEGRQHDHMHRHEHGPEVALSGRTRSLLPLVASLGAAASPDLTILPVFLAAAAAGVGAAVGSLIVFAVVTVATFVVLTLTATVGGYRLGGAWLERTGNLVTAVVLLVLGALVAAGVL